MVLKAFGVERRIDPYYTEDQFTAPRDDCRHPEYWHSADPDSTEVEVCKLVGAWVTALQPDIVVETGTAFADSAVEIGLSLQENGHGKLYTFEPDPQRVKYCRDQVKGLPVEVRQEGSLDGWKSPGPIGFAWFDSLMELRLPELAYFSRWMVPGTIVGFHDTGPHKAQLRLGLEALAGQGILRLIMPPTPRGVCFAQLMYRPKSWSNHAQ